MAEKLYERSILFEIVKGDIVEKSFTLTIPPESYSIDEGQRLYKQKTFGGMVIEDYGPDNPTINIAGNTGNSTSRPTFSSKEGATAKGYTGREAFFYFRKEIMRYKTKMKDYDEYEMRIYDLGSVSTGVIDSQVKNYSIDAYSVVLEKFQLRRSKEKPLFYNYAIDLTVKRILGESPIREFSPKIKAKDKNAFMRILGYVRRGLREMKAVFATIKNIVDTIESAIELIGQLGDQIVLFFDQVLNIITYPAHLAKKLLSELRKFRNDMLTVKDMLNFSDGKFEQILLDERRMESGIRAIVAQGKTQGQGGQIYEVSNSLSRVSESQEDEADLRYSVIVSGYRLVEVKDETTFAGLSITNYNTDIYAELIASYNNMSTMDEIESGDKIKIPVFDTNTPNTANIYSYQKEDYGTDIRLKDGALVFSPAGDFLTISGEKNLIQAINLRLSEELGRRLKLTLYGLATRIGGYISNKMPIAYISTNLKDTLIQDPRILEVQDIRVWGEKDIIHMASTIVGITGKTFNYKGAL